MRSNRCGNSTSTPLRLWICTRSSTLVFRRRFDSSIIAMPLARSPSRRRDLGGDECLLAIADVGQQFADDFFRLPVRRRRVDDRSARGREPGKHFTARGALFRRRRAVVVGPHADRGQSFAGRRHRLGHQRRRRRRLRFVLVLVLFSGPGAHDLRSRQRCQPGLDDLSTSRHFFLRATFDFFAFDTLALRFLPGLRHFPGHFPRPSPSDDLLHGLASRLCLLLRPACFAALALTASFAFGFAWFRLGFGLAVCRLGRHGRRPGRNESQTARPPDP